MAQQSMKKRQPVKMGGPMGGGMGAGEKAKDFKGTVKKLAKYLAEFRWQMLMVAIFAVGSTAFAIVSPKILGGATNQIVEDYVSIKAYETITSKLPNGASLPAGTTGADVLKRLPNKSEIESQIPSNQLDTIKKLDLSQRPEFHFEAIWRVVSLLIGLYVLSAIFRYIQTWLMTQVTQTVTFRMRRQLSEKINRLPLSYFDKQTYGEVLSRVTNDVDTISQTLNQSLSQIVSSTVMVLGILVMMFSISWQMSLVALLVLPLAGGVITLIAKSSQKQFLRQQTQLGELNGHIEEMYGGHQVMRVFNGQKKSLAKFSRINDQLQESAWKAQFLSGLIYPIMNFIGNIGYVVMAILGGWLAINGRLKIGDIQAFIQYIDQFNQPLVQVANIANVLQSTAAAAERVFEFLDEPEEKAEGKDLVKLAHVKGEVEFDNVVFGYKPDQTIIKGLSAHIKPGQRVAIVGPTGAGKTTLVNLLMRFYEINSGAIKIDGVNIADMKRSDVRQLFGMVLQDTWLFNGTIRQNLLYGNPTASEEEMVATAKEAHVDHFVRSLPGGYDMVLGEEATNISQGEKQLLTIARAMLARTPMLILDEATSSVDTRTEVLIQKAMDKLMQGKTSFVIAHRLSTIRDADLILVVRDGNIIEQGKHDELLQQNGFYAELYNSQFAE
ncbi:multidrug ABC transporter ATP-binding protein [Candidatus Nanosynbacter lyticus]|uniref:Multidrug ABC transporter ATP-binding protein n=1 Tax=Candidatus Nanosynbacter lyticus TaxID=2093824 RepID=A0A6S4GQL8_9BACT|nr:ABC transporter ATP-binding protein [Candidatus Nanosynbacter lyticus]AJA06635.1 multidrug ABC transporter ATP-binding protein [Candidatus Nanosynbacter lyticus]QCT41796.1 ABC transporter ATP-binding protein [TM7 phylum sp. oral taxon 952]